jgi:hypothetical protein
MRDKNVFVLVCMFTFVLLAAVPQTRSQESGHGFYYHSREQQAVIISELGSDTQMVVEETGHDYIFGPGPSPSYTWFAYAAGDRLSELYIFSLTDDDRIDIGQFLGLETGIYGQISWARNADALVFDFAGDLSLNANGVYIFYPASKTFSWFPPSDSVRGYEIYQIDWLANDEGVAVYYPVAIELLDITGRTIATFQANLASNRFPVCNQHKPNTILNGQLVYLHPESNDMIIYDIDTQIISRSVELVSPHVDAIFWSADMQYALLFSPRPQPQIGFISEYDVWLYSLSDNMLTEIDIDAGFRLPSYCHGRFAVNLWDDHFAVLSTTQGQVFLIDSVEGSVKEISLP